jgi:hypothetical protein
MLHGQEGSRSAEIRWQLKELASPPCLQIPEGCIGWQST